MATAPEDAAPPDIKMEDAEPAARSLLDEATRADAIYDKCAEAAEGTIFYMRDLSSMGIANDISDLLNIANALVDKYLFKLLSFEGEACWKVRTRGDAEKLRRLTPEDRRIYYLIEDAGTGGVWSKALRARTNMAQPVLNKCLKILEGKDLVQSVMSVKFPSRKMYLLAHLCPSEDVAGGPWQADGEYDTALIDAVARLVERFIHEETYVQVPPNYNNFQALDRASAIAEKKAKISSTDIEDLGNTFDLSSDVGQQNTVPRYNVKYPTAASLCRKVMATGAIKGKDIRESDMTQLLEMMVLDGRLEKVSESNYKLVLKEDEVVGLNGFVDAPCGTCPVFDLCGDSGEISARTCVYFGEWLATGS